MVGCQSRQQPAGRKGRRASHAERVLTAAAVVHCCTHKRQCMLESLPERFSAIGRSQSRPVPPEELHSELRFQRPHSLTYGSRRDAELRSGPRKIAVPDTGSEDTQRIQGWQSVAHAPFEADLEMSVNIYRYVTGT
jgi:hypothetical protein